MQRINTPNRSMFPSGAGWKKWAACLLLLFAFAVAAPAASFADPTAEEDATQITDGTCTSENQFEIEEPEEDSGLIASIIESIKVPLKDVSSSVFLGIVGDEGFRNVLLIASSIYVAIYGIFFTFGMVQITIHDLLVRLVKLGIINLLLSQDAWKYFDDIVVKFFNGAVDDVILHVSTLAFNTATNVGPLVGTNPFDPLDQALIYVVSSKMAITLLATFATGPYGFIIGLILVMSLGSFLKALFNALWIYVMALVIRTIMFGMAPIFIVCILFSRTRHLFDGWLNQIVNATFQPIFLFTFFAFFVLLIKSCLQSLLAWDVCWMPIGTEFGTPTETRFWRFALKDCGNFIDGVQQYVPFGGVWSFTGAEMEEFKNDPRLNCNTEVHPIGVILPLMIWILADLAARFNHIVIEIAKDLSNAATDLSMGSGSIKEWFGNLFSNGGPSSGSGTTGSRTTATSLGDIEKMVRANAPGTIPPTRPGPGTGPPPPPPPPPPPK